MAALAGRVPEWLGEQAIKILCGLFVAIVGGLVVVIVANRCFQPPTPPPPDQVAIDPRCCRFDAEGDDNENKNGEWVCFTNQGGQSADMTGWVVMDEEGHSTAQPEYQYRFPSFLLSPGSSVRLYTGCGTNTAEELHMCKTDDYAWWSNEGDTVYLLDEVGRLVNQLSY